MLLAISREIFLYFAILYKLLTYILTLVYYKHIHECMVAKIINISVTEFSFPNLKPTLKTISLRLPESMLNELKIIANKRDIPYQSLMKMLLAVGC